MIGLICLFICIVPIYLFYISEHLVLMAFSIINAVLNFWSLGIMHNYAIKNNSKWAERVLKNRESEEGPLSKEDIKRLRKISNTLRSEDVPDRLAYINFITAFLGLMFFIVYWFVK